MLNNYEFMQCDCSNEPTILNVKNSVLRLVVAGCKKCKTSGPARMTATKAMTEWNKGRRVLINGEQVSNSNVTIN